MNTSTSLRSTLLWCTVTISIFAACLTLISCNSNKIVDTGRTFDVYDFSETNAREVLELAVRNECSKSSVGISPGLTSALRIVDSIPAVQIGDNWEFRYEQKTALVTPLGIVSGELLWELIAQCR